MSPKPASKPARSLSDKTISGLRSAYYGLTEPCRLRLARRAHANSGITNSAHGGDPVVSVYIPTHNRVDLLLERALPSVLSQTYTNLEIIVAAHGCTDGTIEKCTEFVAHHPKMRDWEWVQIATGWDFMILDVSRRKTYPPTAENHWLAGPVVPANAALKVCTGDWIARIDDDDTWTPDHIEKLLKFAQEGNYEFVSSAYKTHEKTVGAEDGIGGTQTWLYRSYLKFMKYNPDCWRKNWHRVNDLDLAERFRKAGVWIGYLDEVTAEVLPRPGEATVGLKAYLEDADVKERMLAF